MGQSCEGEAASGTRLIRSWRGEVHQQIGESRESSWSRYADKGPDGTTEFQKNVDGIARLLARARSTS